MPGIDSGRERETAPHPNELIARQWIAAFNVQDIERLLSLYDKDAKHYSPKLKNRQPETQGWIQGTDSLKEWWKGSFTRLPSLRYKLTSLTANDERVFMEYIRSVEGEEDTTVAEVLEIKEGKIVASRVYHG